MGSYNLTQIVDFPTRITNTSETLIDTVFIDTSIYGKTQVQPTINGISDHDAQFLSTQIQHRPSAKKVPSTHKNETN
jgi:hypothetical protein